MAVRDLPSTLSRVVFGAVCASLAALGLGQKRSEVEEALNDSFVSTRTHDSLFVHLTGLERTGKRLTYLTYNLSFLIRRDVAGGIAGAYLDVEAYKNGIFDHRLCGDGVTLWKYLYTQASYQPVRYGIENGPPPAGYLDSLLREFGSMADPYETRLATMLRQVYASAGSNYESWMPAVQPSFAAGIWTYAAKPPGETILFTLALDTQPDPTGKLAFPLGSITYTNSIPVGSTTREFSWRAILTLDLTYKPNTFLFVPPRGARAIKT
jgi:hypothetical protein